MASSNEELRDLQIRHAVHLLHYGNGLEGDILKLLRSTENDVLERLAGRLALIDERGFDLGPATTKRLNDMLEELRALIDGVYGKVNTTLADNLTALAGNEVEFQTKALSASMAVDIATKTPAPALLKAIVTERPIHGAMLKSWVKGASTKTMDSVEQAVRLGMEEGQGIETIVRRIKGTKAKNYKDGVMEKRRDKARALVRTSINHTANHAAQETWRANEDVVKGWQFVATLDSRTTPICGSLDGQVFKIGEGPVPPRHPSCRSITTAVTKSFKELGLDRDEYTPEQRASVDGQVAAPVRFENWLKNQSEERQEAVLGKTRADLWRRGKLNLNDFIRDHREVISLDDLKKLHPKAFSTASATASATAPVAKRFVSPINPKVTGKTVEVMPRLAAQKQLTSKFTEAAKDQRYSPLREYRNTRPGDFGKASFPTDLSDEAASVFHALAPELDTLATVFNVPRLRGMKKTTSAIANMGDGVMGINPVYFNSYALQTGAGNTARLATLQKELDVMKARLQTLQTRLTEIRTERVGIAMTDPRFLDLMDEENKLVKEFNALVKPHNALHKSVATARRVSEKPVSLWKIGDDVKDRPFNSVDYFEGIDKARSVLFHEFGHHVHQMHQKKAPRRVESPPLEKELFVLFSRKFPRTAEGRKNLEKLSSSYATTDRFEWFAENFSLYMMGRKDLVDDDVKEIIERLINEQSN